MYCVQGDFLRLPCSSVTSLRAPHHPRDAWLGRDDGGCLGRECQTVVALVLEVDRERAAVFRLPGLAHHTAEIGVPATHVV
jgi:hypothetical protein